MTDQRPDSGDPTASPDPVDPTAASPGQEDAELDTETPSDTSTSEADADSGVDAEQEEAADSPDEADEADAVDLAADAGVGVAAATAAAWTTTPVAPDPEATEAALAALAARPEVTVEPPEGPPPPPLGMDEEPPEEGTPVLLVGGILVGAFIVALAIVILLFRPFDSGSPDVTLSPSPAVTEVPSASPSAEAVIDTPNFQGLSLAEAEATADDYGLVVRVTSVETDDEDPGTVLSQQPPPGESVPVGSTIELSVAVPTATVAVPDIIDLPEAEALTALTTAGLSAGTRTLASDPVIVAGNVISSTPVAATEVARGSAVAYVVSTGPALVAVPDIIDLPEAEALTALTTAGLSAGTRTLASDPVIVAGNVISSTPVAATEVARGSAVAYVVSTGPALVAVPDIIDLPEAEALTALTTAGLSAGTRTLASDPVIVAGNVISSTPVAATEVARGSAVAYVVSTGPALVAVPDIIDLPEAEALTALTTAGLSAGTRTLASDPVIVAGNVISSTPVAATEVARGSAVAYVVSTGPALVAVPAFEGMILADAQADATSLGLVLKTTSVETTESVPNTILDQDPTAGTMVVRGSTVDVDVAIAPEQVAVPDLAGPADAAEQALADARLVGAPTEAFSADVPAGDVISQDPAAGTSVPVGATVAYQVSLGVETVAVPDLAGPADAAEQALADARLVGAPTEAFSADVPAGDVISQDPAAGTSVPVGATVAYQVSLGVETVAVPDLAGPADAAEQALADARLVGAPTEAFSADVPAGDVISQDPAAGTSVPVGATVAYQVSLGVETVAVPDLAGPADAAEQALADARLVGAPTEAFSADVPAGDVISQDPAAGTSVPVGATVAYQVSLGVETVAVPDLAGPADAAEQALADARLVGAPTEAFSADVPAGDVISQDPAAGTSVPVGATVAYQVSLGVETVAVPDLAGPADAAEQALADARLVGAPTEAFSADVPAGDVISQDPAAGTSVPVGATVAYQVSLGVETVAVPDLAGPADAAEQALADARLVGAPTEAFSADVPAGDVISQDPAAGTSVPVGATVAYQVSLGVETVAVPDLAGPADAAEQALADARLVGAPTEAFSADVPAGDVISQDPAAGTSVPVGATVAYQVSLGVETVAVPDLAGPADAAEQALADARLVGAPTEAFSADVPAGDVISQDPAAGTSVPVGATVAYQVSLGVETVAVPDLAGPADAAEQALADARLVGAPTEAFSADVPAGDVISQDPAAGTSVPVGATVAYQVSLGVETVAVPDLAGPADAAEQALADARLVGAPTEAFSADVPAGDVISQDPAAGTSVPVGATVAYQVSLGVETVAVPDLAGPADAAEQALADARLVGAPTEAFSADVPAGDVISQDPAAGTSVPVGATVAYQVSLGVETVAVPDLAGPADAAEQALADARLVGAPTEAFSADVPAGDVISQDPAAGTSVPVGATVAYQVSLGVETVAVPDLAGPADAAEQALADARLVGAPTEAFSADVPAGDVISQDPAAGTSVPVGATVAYQVSLGVETVAVPDLAGPADAAEQALADARLVGAPTEAFSADVPAGDVISQDPAAGTSVPVGATVAYQVSLGVETVAVPDLAGPADAAEQALADARLVGAPTEAFSADVPAGDVISQDPAAGTSVPVGATVAYQVSLGVSPNVAVPAVRDLPEADAIAVIEDAGLIVGETIAQSNEKVAAGDAIKTTPAADEEIPLGSEVALYVSAGSSLTVVPEVKGLAEADANATIAAAGLVVGATEQKTNATMPAGQAVKTDPAAGTEVQTGSAVTLTISKGPKQVSVPAIVGLLQPDAKAAIEAAELTVGTSSVVEDPSPKNTVLSQDPPADSVVAAGSAVNYTVSSGPPLTVVPEVKGLAEADANATIAAAGLVVGATEQKTNATMPAGQAVKTDPAAGTEVQTGSAVTLTISKGPKQVSVPAIVGLLQPDAKAAIEAAELTVGTSSVVEDPSPKNTVLSQDPPADSVVAAGSAVNYTVSSGPPLTVVPEVKGLAEADANATIAAAGLVVGATEQKTNATMPAGQAVKTDPAAGTEVQTGSAVTLTISKGPKQVSVPAIVGLLQPDAKAAIEAAELTVGTSSVVEDPSPKNTVLSQDPPADSVVAAGSAVNYTVSSGPPLTVVPEVKGLAEADANATIAAAGLVVGATEQKTNATMPAGQAVKTDPAAGTEVQTGSAVTLTISKGPKQVSVPAIVGLLQPDAKAAIEAAELTVGTSSVVEDPSPKNTVLSQDPPADSVVAAGSAVNYTVSSGPPLTVVPEVKGLAEADANATIAAAGLVVGATEQKTNATMPAGQAVKTDPAAGTEVQTGSAVTLTISKGPKQVSVPAIVGLAEADALATLTAAEVTPGARSEINDPAVPAGVVLSQDPPPGTTVIKDTAVAYTVSLGPPIEPRGVGGTLQNPTVIGQLDTIAAAIPTARELPLGTVPYDAIGAGDQRQNLSARSQRLHDPASVPAEDRALKRMGLLGEGSDLATLLDQLYGQPLPAAYQQGSGHLSVIDSIEKLTVGDQAEIGTRVRSSGCRSADRSWARSYR